jgi:hypothetical protein
MSREVKTMKTLPDRRGLLVSGVLLSLSLASCAAEPPEAALDCAVEASVAEDREAYAACFTPRSRAFLGAFWGAAGAARPELLPRGGEAVVIHEVRALIDPDADTARALVVVSEGAPERELRVILHELGGRWRIDLWDTAGAQFGVRGL